MAAQTVTFPGPLDEQIVPHVTIGQGTTVYARSRWADPWTANPHLIPAEVTWSVAPTLPIAVLEAHYGYVMQPDGQQYEEVTRASITDLVGQFVKIVCYTQTGQHVRHGSQLYRTWWGIIEEAHDEQGGAANVHDKPYGKITLVAYGLEKLLSDHVLIDSVCEDYSGFEVVVDVALDFNRAGPRGTKGNRSSAKVSGSYVFGGNGETATTWSSYDILEYLIQHQTPLDHLNNRIVPFTMSLPPGLPTNTDKPLVKAENATTYSIISQLLDRRRGTMWWLEVDEDTNSVQIKADTMVVSPVTGNKISIPASSRQVNLVYDSDSMTNAVINNSSLPRFDQVVAQGPRIRCVGSWRNAHSNIEAVWTSTEETTYEAGGTPHPGGTPLRRKQVRNATVRESPTLENVFSLFQVPDDWDMNVGDPAYPLFIDDDDALLKQCVPELTIEQSMPLLEGVDYSGSRIGAGLPPISYGTDEEMKPFVLFLKPWVTSAPYKYQAASGFANLETTNPKDNPRLNCHVSVPRNTKSIRVKVQGEPQHAIAFATSGLPTGHGSFTPISGEDAACGEFDWRNAVFTFSMLSQQRTEGRWPVVLTQGDAIRRKVIYAGDQYFRDYVAPYTVVGLDENAELVYSTTGGWLPMKGGDNDPEKLLQDIAKIAAAWYTVQHYVLSLESYRLKPPGDIPLGALVIKAGGDPEGEYAQQVNAPVTQITYTYPNGAESPKPARMTIKTWAGELDAVEFVAVKPPAFVEIAGRRISTSRVAEAVDRMRGGDE